MYCGLFSSLTNSKDESSCVSDAELVLDQPINERATACPSERLDDVWSGGQETSLSNNEGKILLSW